MISKYYYIAVLNTNLKKNIILSDYALHMLEKSRRDILLVVTLFRIRKFILDEISPRKTFQTLPYFWNENPRFTKRTFVWGKNTQAFEIFYLLWFVTLDTNIPFTLQLRQRFRFHFNFFIFFQDLLAFTTIIFCLFHIIFYLSQVWSRIAQLLRAMFLFSLYNDFVLIFSLNGCCGAKVTQNEKWRQFGGRWRNLKTDSIFKLEKEVGLCKPPQVSGYFCLEQKSFLWILNPHNFVTLS